MYDPISSRYLIAAVSCIATPQTRTEGNPDSYNEKVRVQDQTNQGSWMLGQVQIQGEGYGDETCKQIYMYVGIGGPKGILLKPCVYEVYLCDMHDMRHMLRVIITLSNNYY